MKAKPALRSIKDVHSRLKWDGGIPTEAIFIGYVDRMRGLVEMPFSDFTPGGRVPWDRIQYFRLGDQRIWDRESRIDMIFGSGDTPPNMQIQFQATEGVVGAGWQRIPALIYDALEGSWEAAESPQTMNQPSWKTFSFNLLSNHFLHDKARDPKRYQLILDYLGALGADLITLQEADREFWELLMATPWVQCNYFLIDNRHIAQERSHFELVLVNIAPSLAMAPIVHEECRSILLAFTHKGSRFWVLNLHLFSDSGANAHPKREEYLLQILAQIPAEETVLLQGDFNFGDEHASPALAEFTDFWQQLHPGAPGITYDGSHNPMSKKVIPNARDRRLDRMMVRTESGFPLAEEIAVVHVKDDASGEYLSDHYALRAQLSFGGSFGSLRRAPKTHHSALALLPPDPVWQEIQGLRKQYDSSFSRWMPHINLLYGFIPQPYFAEAAVVLQNALMEIDPFELTLEGFDSFEHADSTTIWLRPDGKAIAKLQEIQEICRSLFPNCDEQNRLGAWNPHLTVAKISQARRREAKDLIAEWNRIWKPITFTVSDLSMIARAGQSRFKIEETIRLNPKAQAIEAESHPSKLAHKGDLRTCLGKLGLLPSTWQQHRRNAIALDLANAALKLRLPAFFTPVGSFALGTLLPDSDLDFLCMSHLPQAEFFQAFQRHVPGLTLARVAANALVPTLRMEIGDVEADVMYLQLPDSIPVRSPDQWTADAMAQLSPAQLRVLNANEDLRIVQRLIEGHEEAFQVAAIALKAWADVHDIAGNAFGYPGGFAWTLMLAQSGPHKEPEAWIAAFLEQFFERNWTGLDDSGNALPMQLQSGALGAINITRNVTARTFDTIKAAIEEALLQVWAIWDGESSWETFFKPSPQVFPSAIQLDWQAGNIADLEAASGWIQSQVIALLRDLEALPFLKTRAGGAIQKSGALRRSYEIGLSSLPMESETARIYELLDNFEKAFHEKPNGTESAKLRTKVELEMNYATENAEL